LQHVLGVGGVAGDAIGRAEDQAVMSPEGSLEFVWDRDSGFLDNEYALQGTPPGSAVTSLKTVPKQEYYRWGLQHFF
jgi:hypothetical protein